MDLGLGSVAGISLAMAQGLAPQGPSWISFVLHALALATAGAVVLLVVRRLRKETLTSTWVGTLLLAVVMALVSRAMGYRLVLE